MTRKLTIVFLLFSLMLGSVTQVAFASTADQIAVPVLVVNTSFLNVRSGDGPQYSVLAVVVGGMELPVLGTNSSNSWYMVSTPVGAGWVDVTFTLPRGDFRGVPELEPTVGTAPQVTAPTSIGLFAAAAAQAPAGAPVAALALPRVVINTSYQNVRTGPGPQFDVIVVVPGGTQLEVVGVTTDTSWYQVIGSFGQGWVSSDFVLFRGIFANVPVIHSVF